MTIVNNSEIIQTGNSIFPVFFMKGNKKEWQKDLNSKNSKT